MTKQDDKVIPNFLGVFEHKLVQLKKQIKRELEKPKKDRHKADLKEMFKTAKKLQAAIDRVKDQHAVTCPHCGKDI